MSDDNYELRDMLECERMMFDQELREQIDSLKAHAVEVLAIRLGLHRVRSLERHYENMSESEFLSHFWDDFKNECTNEARALLGWEE